MRHHKLLLPRTIRSAQSQEHSCFHHFLKRTCWQWRNLQTLRNECPRIRRDSYIQDVYNNNNKRKRFSVRYQNDDTSRFGALSRSNASDLPAVPVRDTSTVIDAEGKVILSNTHFSVASAELSGLVLATRTSILAQTISRKCFFTVTLVTIAILDTPGSVQANVRVLSTRLNVDITSVTNISIGADTVLKVLVVCLVELRFNRTEVELVQKADIFDTLATLSAILALKRAPFVAAILFRIMKLTHGAVISFKAVASNDTEQANVESK